MIGRIVPSLQNSKILKKIFHSLQRPALNRKRTIQRIIICVSIIKINHNQKLKIDQEDKNSKNEQITYLRKVTQHSPSMEP
jgi:hypothetical protein